VTAALAEQAVDIVVLPELSTLDYSRATFAALDVLSEPLDGPTFQVWARVAQAQNCHVVYGFARRDGAQNYICIAVVGPDGVLVGHYDKIHLAQFGASMEKEYFSAGRHLFTFEVKGFRLAPIICYDIRIPELCRTLALDHGADVILHCGAYYRDESFATWHAFAQTRAIENQIYFLSLNRAGEQYGSSMLCLPWMDDTLPAVALPKHAEALSPLTLDRTALDHARENYSFRADRLERYDRLDVIKA
jgi:nitrilase